MLDSGSTDDTVARARAAGARVIETDWPGHVIQKNRALAEAKGEWVLSLDADERVSPALRAAVEAALARPTADGYRVARRNHWLGHPLRHGHWYPDWRVRLARRDKANFVGDDPHDRMEVAGTLGTLTGDLEHIPYRNLGEHLATIDRYTATAARQARAQGKRSGYLAMVLRPVWHFFSGYLLRQGFRDGVPGLIVASMGALYILLKCARIQGIGLDPPPDKT